MTPMTYPTSDGSTQAAWLQHTVGNYFAGIQWEASIKPHPVRAEPVDLSLDMTVVQYFANFAWGDDAPIAAQTPANTSVKPHGSFEHSLAELLDFEPTVDPDAILDTASQEDSGSLADFSDFF